MFLPHEEESGDCYAAHPDLAPCRHRPRAGSLCSTSLPLSGYVGGPVGPAGTISQSLVKLPLPSPQAPVDHQTRLCDSVCPKFHQVQGHPVKSRWLMPLSYVQKSPADMRSGFMSPYFIVPKKSSGLRPILDLRVLIRAFHKLLFKMLMQKYIFESVHPLDWFAAIDLKDAQFHVSILP